jgi:glycosyltransferase involved in cell wall biosynthesis
MKIIHLLLGKANPNTMNGVNVVVHNLATAQLEQGLDVEVWGITNTPTKIHHKFDYELKLFQKKKVPFFIDTALKEKILELKVDTIVQIHSAFIPEFFAITRILNKLSIPYVVTSHGAYDKATMNDKKIKKSIYFKLFEYKILNSATLLHFMGKNEKINIEKMGISTKKVLIPNGVEKINLNSVDKKNTNITFLYCGRIAIYHKGLDLLVSAFISYKSHGGKGILKLIGDGPELNVLINQAESFGRLSNSIQFLGKKFSNDKLEVLSSSDVFIHTSRHDGMPIAVLEAAELSIPLLISEETNMGTYVRKYNAGIVLENNNTDNIEKTLFEMEDLFAKGKLKEYGVNAKKMIENELNWNNIAQIFNIQYRNILGTE